MELERTGEEVSWEAPGLELETGSERGAELATDIGRAGAEACDEALPGPVAIKGFPFESCALARADAALCTMFKVIFNLAEFELTGGDALGRGCNLDEKGTLDMIFLESNKKINKFTKLKIYNSIY